MSNKGDEESLYAPLVQSNSMLPASIAIPESPVSLALGGGPIPGEKIIDNPFIDFGIKIQLGRGASAYFSGLLFALSFAFYRIFRWGDFAVPFVLSILGYLIFAPVDKQQLHQPSEARPQRVRLAKLLVTLGILLMLGGGIGGIVILGICGGRPIGWAAFFQNLFIALSAVLLWRVQRKPKEEGYNLTI